MKTSKTSKPHNNCFFEWSWRKMVQKANFTVRVLKCVYLEMIVMSNLPNACRIRSYGPRRSDKTCIRGFRQSKTQTSPTQLQRLETWNFAYSKCISLSNKRITKALIRLRGCTGWCAPLLFETPKTWFLALKHHMHLVAKNPTLFHANNKAQFTLRICTMSSAP